MFTFLVSGPGKQSTYIFPRVSLNSLGYDVIQSHMHYGLWDLEFLNHDSRCIRAPWGLSLRAASANPIPLSKGLTYEGVGSEA